MMNDLKSAVRQLLKNPGFTVVAVMVWIGLAIGFTATLALSRVLQRMVFAISPTDPATLATVMLITTVAALLGCALPALRAARINPTEALRHE